MTSGRCLFAPVLTALILFTPAAYSDDARVRLPVTEGHDLQFTRLSVAGESFQSRVPSIAQDRYGFLWFGTDDGLYRYDGYTLKPYRHESDNQNSLTEDGVTCLYRDPAGILWVGTTYGGLDRLDPASDTFTHYRHDPANPGSLSANAVSSISQDTGGALWVGTNHGLDRLDPATGTFAHYVNNSQDVRSLSSDGVWRLFGDRSGNLWAGTVRGGLNRLDPGTGLFSRYSDPDSPRRPGDDSSDLALSRIREDHSGVLWVGTAFGTLDPKTAALTHYAFRSNEHGDDRIPDVRTIQEDPGGVLWLGTIRGLLALDRERKQFVRYAKNPANPHSLITDDILSLFEDAEGNIWVGAQNGVSRFNRKPRFINLEHEPGNPKGLVDNFIRAVQVDSRGVLWVGTNQGLQRVDPKSGRFTLYQHDFHDAQSLSNNYVSVIREDRSGTLWVGTGGGGLNRFDRATGKFFAYRYDPNKPAGLGSDGIVSLLEDREGILWVATGAGLAKWDRRSGRFTQYRHNPDDPQSLPADLTRAVFEDRSGILWVGSVGGLGRFDRATQKFTTYRHNPKDPTSLSHDQVNAIWEDQRGSLWVATQDGLNQMDRSRGTFTIFTRRNGLPDNAIQSILEDDRGSLWLGTSNGLSQFQPLTGTFRNYSESDGLPGNSLNPIGTEGSCRAPDGEMWFGSRNGLTSFHPDRISANPYVPPVVLTEFLMFNTPVLPGGNAPLGRPIWAVDSLTLNHQQSIFSLEFAALSYTAPEKNRYRYRLEPYESDWNRVDSRRRLATYTGLPPGKYVFRVQASNNGDVWNEKGVALPITILPPAWATWWFRSLFGLSIAGLVFAAYRSRVRSLHLGAAKLEAQVLQRTAELSERNRELQIAKNAADAANRAKSTFLANMSHELRTPLNAILGFSSLLRAGDVSEKQRKDLDIINRSGESLLTLINDVLDVAKIEAGRVELEIATCEVTSLVRDAADLMLGRAQEKHLTLVTALSVEPSCYVRTDAAKLRQILINLLGNAIKFTERGSVTVRLDAGLADAAGRLPLTLCVEDTGIGIAEEDQAHIFEAFVQVGKPSARSGTGLGLAITRQFVKLLGGTIQLESRLGEGSRFLVKLPVERAPEPDVTPEAAAVGSIILEPGEPEYRVLIVEDDEESRVLLERLVRNAGFQVRVSPDGAHGVELFRTWRPHFIWMDLRMSGMDGAETARQIRALEGGRDVKIAAVSASVFADERNRVLTAGLDDFVAKPYRSGEIFNCMACQLGVRYHRIEPAPAAAEPAAALRPEALGALPEELRVELRDALIALDDRRIALAIRRVSEQDSALGSVLARRADRFAYTAIFEALEAARHNRPAESR